MQSMGRLVYVIILMETFINDFSYITIRYNLYIMYGAHLKTFVHVLYFNIRFPVLVLQIEVSD